MLQNLYINTNVIEDTSAILRDFLENFQVEDVIEDLEDLPDPDQLLNENEMMDFENDNGYEALIENENEDIIILDLDHHESVNKQSPLDCNRYIQDFELELLDGDRQNVEEIQHSFTVSTESVSKLV